MKRHSAEERRWYAAVASLETCSLCRAYGVQVAHRNEGRGLGQKSSYHLTAAICPPEHYEIDNGKTMTQAERRAAWNAAYVDTVNRLIAVGRLVWRGALPASFCWHGNDEDVDEIDRLIRAGELVLK